MSLKSDKFGISYKFRLNVFIKQATILSDIHASANEINKMGYQRIEEIHTHIHTHISVCYNNEDYFLLLKCKQTHKWKR